MPAASPDYRPRAPERDVLRRVICEHLETFLDRATSRRDGGNLPGFVRREFQKYVTCGALAGGFARFRCAGCGFDRLVPFSCKGRGFCPSCGGRRMVERAAHLVDRVLPAVPIRQWVLTMPPRVRYLLAWNHDLTRAVVAVFLRAVMGRLRPRNGRRGAGSGRAGAVAAIRFRATTRLSQSFAVQEPLRVLYLGDRVQGASPRVAALLGRGFDVHDGSAEALTGTAGWTETATA